MFTFIFTPLQLSFTTHPHVIIAGNFKRFKKIPNDNGSLEDNAMTMDLFSRN